MLERIEVRDFRNLAPQSWEPGPGQHLIFGSNGAGKTSLLEAIYVAATTRSFRTAKLPDCCQRTADAFTVEAVVHGTRRFELLVSWQRGPGGGHRSRLLDGHTASLAEHLAALPVLAWTAADADLLSGPPALRRRLLDRGIVSLRPSTIAVLARYRRALAAKRRLLTAGVRPSSAELSTWNAILGREAAPLVRARAAYAESLSRALGEVQDEVPLDLPPLDLTYRPSLEAGGDSEAVTGVLDAAAPRECTAKRALLGPHLDDLKIAWQGRTVRRMASAGERKALGLLLLAAQGRVVAAAGRPPTLLVDDADTELDQARLAAVWPALQGAKQLFATSNRPEVWAAIESTATWSVDETLVAPRSRLFSNTK